MGIGALIFALVAFAFIVLLLNKDRIYSHHGEVNGSRPRGRLVLKITNGGTIIKVGTISSQDKIFVDSLLNKYRVRSGAIERISYSGSITFTGVPEQI